MVLGPAPATGNLESRQISFSNEAKLGPLLTDGARLYFESRNVPSAMSVSGGMIAPIPGLTGGMYLVDVIADGSKVLVWAQNMNNEARGGWFLTGSSLGGAWRKIGTGRDASPIARWASDGKSIYFVESKQVWVMDKDGGDARPLWKPPQPPIALAVSPDGKQLAVTLLSRTPRIWLVGSDGKDPHPLALDWPTDAEETQGQWTPAGRRFLFNCPSGAGRGFRQRSTEGTSARDRTDKWHRFDSGCRGPGFRKITWLAHPGTGVQGSAQPIRDFLTIPTLLGDMQEDSNANTRSSNQRPCRSEP